MSEPIENSNLNRLFKAHLVSSQEIVTGIKKLTFEIEQPFSYLPWQYVWVEIPHLPIPDAKGSRRAFSIFNTQNNSNTIEVVARISQTGYKQSLFALSPGDEVVIHGPFGSSFMVDEKSDKNIIMIAGGLGIAAFLRLIKTINDYPNPQKCFLVYINQRPEDTPFIDELEELKHQHRLFDFRVIYERFSWDHVSQKQADLSPNLRWMIAGTQNTVNHVFDVLQKAGVSPSNMEFENFYPTSPGNLTRNIIEDQLKENNLFISALQASTHHTIITDTNGVVVFANKAAQQITGYTESEIIGNTPRLWGGMMSHDYYVNFWKNKASGINLTQRIINRRKTGQIYHAVAHISCIRGANQEIIGYVATEEDITELVETENILSQKIHDIERLNRIMVGRELKMIELKAEIKRLQDTHKSV